jgi:hypothetical protein
MTVKIDGTEPNVFPAVEGVDVHDAGRNALAPARVVRTSATTILAAGLRSLSRHRPFFVSKRG